MKSFEQHRATREYLVSFVLLLMQFKLINSVEEGQRIFNYLMDHFGVWK